jgi:hypothetical protein
MNQQVNNAIGGYEDTPASLSPTGDAQIAPRTDVVTAQDAVQGVGYIQDAAEDTVDGDIWRRAKPTIST